MAWNTVRKVQEPCEERFFGMTVFLEFSEVVGSSDGATQARKREQPVRCYLVSKKVLVGSRLPEAR